LDLTQRSFFFLRSHRSLDCQPGLPPPFGGFSRASPFLPRCFFSKKDASPQKDRDLETVSLMRSIPPTPHLCWALPETPQWATLFFDFSYRPFRPCPPPKTPTTPRIYCFAEVIGVSPFLRMAHPPLMYFHPTPPPPLAQSNFGFGAFTFSPSLPPSGLPQLALLCFAHPPAFSSFSMAKFSVLLPPLGPPHAGLDRLC